MSRIEMKIREIQPEDDFGPIRELLLANARPPMFFPQTCENIGKWFFSNQVERIGYMAVSGTEMIAFIGFERRGLDGVFVYAIHPSEPNPREVLGALLEPIIELVREKGGRTLGYFAFTEFGQLRNPEIALLEQLGFRPQDEYMRVSTKLRLHDWAAPPELDTTGIQPEPLDLNEMAAMMMEDENGQNAIIFKHQYQRAETRNVMLTLRNADQTLMGFAYYKVIKSRPDGSSLSAAAFNMHFRPQFELTRQEKQRFLQAALHSMKQLELNSVNSLQSLKRPDIFTLLVREGFDEIQSTFYALGKRIGE